MKRALIPFYICAAAFCLVVAIVSFQSAPTIAANPVGHPGMTSNGAMFVITVAGFYFGALALIMGGFSLLMLLWKDE